MTAPSMTSRSRRSSADGAARPARALPRRCAPPEAARQEGGSAGESGEVQAAGAKGAGDGIGMGRCEHKKNIAARGRSTRVPKKEQKVKSGIPVAPRGRLRKKKPVAGMLWPLPMLSVRNDQAPFPLSGG